MGWESTRRGFLKASAAVGVGLFLGGLGESSAAGASNVPPKSGEQNFSEPVGRTTVSGAEAMPISPKDKDIPLDFSGFSINLHEFGDSSPALLWKSPPWQGWRPNLSYPTALDGSPRIDLGLKDTLVPQSRLGNINTDSSRLVTNNVHYGFHNNGVDTQRLSETDQLTLAKVTLKSLKAINPNIGTGTDPSLSSLEQVPVIVTVAKKDGSLFSANWPLIWSFEQSDSLSVVVLSADTLNNPAELNKQITEGFKALGKR